MQIPVSQIQRFCMHDGPGIRTVVFFKGCPLSCRWCHKPETQSFENQIMFDAEKCIGCGSCDACPHGAQTERKNCIGCGACTALCPTGARENTLSMMPMQQVLEIVLRDRAFYGASGGITLSGGEPMAHPMEAIALLKRAKEEGITTAMETCGFFSEEYLPELKKYCDVFLWDIKDLNDVRHKENTGVSNQIILKNLKQLDRLGAKIILRCIIARLCGCELEENVFTMPPTGCFAPTRQCIAVLCRWIFWMRKKNTPCAIGKCLKENRAFPLRRTLWKELFLFIR